MCIGDLIRTIAYYHLPQNWFLGRGGLSWPCPPKEEAGQRLASAAEVPIAIGMPRLDLLVLLHQGKRSRRKKIKAFSILPHRHTFPEDDSEREGNNLLILLPWVPQASPMAPPRRAGYKNVAPRELFWVIISSAEFFVTIATRR